MNWLRIKHFFDGHPIDYREYVIVDKGGPCVKVRCTCGWEFYVPAG